MLFQKLLKPATAAGIQYVGAATGSGTTSGGTVTVSLTGLTGGIASSAAISDVVVISIGVAGSTSIPATPTVSGYTQVVSTGGADTNATCIYTGYKVLTSADTSVSYTWVASNGSSTVYVSVWRNVDATYPLDVATKSTGTQNSILANPPAITPITSGAYIVASGAGAGSAGAQTYSSSDLTNFRSLGANNTYDSLIGGGYNQWISGSFNPAAFTFSTSDSSTYSNASVILALRPFEARTVFPTIVGSNYSNLAGTVTVPSHQAGDWIVFLNGTTGTTTAPALTSGFTNITTFNNSATGANRGARAQYIISDGTIATLSCSTYGGVVILRNVTALASSKSGSTTSTTAATSFTPTMTPTIPGSLCILAGYDPDNFRSASAGLNLISRFGGYAYSDAISSAVTGTLLYWTGEYPAYFGAEFY